MEEVKEEIVHTRGTPEFRQEEMVDKRRRIPGEPKKSFEATQMWDRYHEIARRVTLGQKNTEIANALGVTPEMVSYVRNSPLVQEKITELQVRADNETVDVSKRIKNLAPHAIKLLEDLIVSGKIENEKIPARIRLKHAESVLDRAGHAAPKEVRSLNLHGHYTSEELEEIKARARNSAMKSSTVIVVNGDGDE